MAPLLSVLSPILATGRRSWPHGQRRRAAGPREAVAGMTSQVDRHIAGRCWASRRALPPPSAVRRLCARARRRHRPGLAAMRRWAWGACALALTLRASSAALEDAASSGVPLALELQARCPDAVPRLLWLPQRRAAL